MTDRVDVTRSIELDLEPGEVWELIGVGERWADWMVDTADVEVAPGAGGSVVDGDETREVRIGTVDAGEGISFEWWPRGHPEEASSVDLRIVPAIPGTVLEVVETFPTARTAFALSARATWRVRAVALQASRRMLLAA
jgi:hypothetical protein